MAQRQTIVTLVAFMIIILQMQLVFGKLWTSDGLIKNVKHPPCKPVPGVEGRMLRSLPKPTNSDSCPANGIANVGPGNCEIKKESPAKIFVTDGGTPNKIFVAELQDELIFTSIPATNNPQYITYDSVDKKIYWGDGVTGPVFRANVDGTNRETVTCKVPPTGLAIAERLRTLYIASGSGIMEVSIGQGISMPGDKKKFAKALGMTLSVGVDREQSYLYWTEYLDGTGTIRRRSLIGNGNSQQLNIGKGFYQIHLSIGPTNGGLQRIILSDHYTNKAIYIDVQPNGYVGSRFELTEYVTSSMSGKKGLGLHDVAFFNGVLYWTKQYNPPSIAVMTNYQYDNRSYEIKEISEIRRPFGLLVTTVDP